MIDRTVATNVGLVLISSPLMPSKLEATPRPLKAGVVEQDFSSLEL
jgi:hypothetical protein